MGLVVEEGFIQSERRVQSQGLDSEHQNQRVLVNIWSFSPEQASETQRRRMEKRWYGGWGKIRGRRCPDAGA